MMFGVRDKENQIKREVSRKKIIFVSCCCLCIVFNVCPSLFISFARSVVVVQQSRAEWTIYVAHYFCLLDIVQTHPSFFPKKHTHKQAGAGWDYLGNICGEFHVQFAQIGAC